MARECGCVWGGGGAGGNCAAERAEGSRIPGEINTVTGLWLGLPQVIDSERPCLGTWRHSEAECCRV